MTSQFRRAVDLEVEKQLMLAERDELEADKLELQADRAEFRAEKLEWQVTKGGSSAKGPCDCQAWLKAERLQLETEKTQLRVAQSQLKDAQSQLEAAKSQLETAQTQLEKAREQLEIARKHLEAAKAQTDIDNTRLEAAKASLEAAKMRFGAAAKQLNAAKSRFEAAKTRLDLASSSIEAEKSHLQDEKASLEIKVSEVESEKAKLEVKLSQLENDKFELGSELRESKEENKRLLEKMEGVVKQLEQCCKDKKALQANTANPKVFLDITINGAKAGRVVIELYVDTSPICSESFRALCTGEKGINRNNGKPLHYKGSTFFSISSSYIRGGNITSGIDKEIHSDGLDFPAENFTRKHSDRGMVGMGSHTAGYSNKYEFDVTTDKTESWDNTYVVLGQVIEGMNVVMAMKNAGSGANCVIADCGQLF
ncbi:hypothetical protein QQ045_003296 [Rhodiola kirilowii]